MTDNVIDINTRKPSERLEIDESLPIAKYFDTWKRKAKEDNLQSVIVIAVDKEGYIQYDIRNNNDLHLFQMYIELDEMKAVVKDMIYPDIDVDLDE